MGKAKRVHVGIDVAAEELAVAVRIPGKEVTDRTFKNTAAGHRQLVTFLRRRGAEVRVCLEATGNYSLDVALALASEPNIEVMLANPRVTRKFFEASNLRAKTDKIDARGLMEFTERMDFVRWTPPSATVLQLRAVTRRVHNLTVARTRELNRLKAAEATASTPDSVREDIKDSISDLTRRIDKMSAEALRIAASDEKLAGQVKNLASIRGIGEATAVVMVAEFAMLPDDLAPKQVAAHAGLDPRTRESGTSVRGRGAISKRGNRRIRGALYMPAMSCTQYEPAITEFYQRLVARNKPKTAALVAVMRRLVETMWVMTKTGQRFDPSKFRPKVAAAA